MKRYIQFRSCAHGEFQTENNVDNCGNASTPKPGFESGPKTSKQVLIKSFYDCEAIMKQREILVTTINSTYLSTCEIICLKCDHDFLNFF